MSTPHELERKVARRAVALALAVAVLAGAGVVSNYVQPRASGDESAIAAALPGPAASETFGVAPSRPYRPVLISRAQGDARLKRGFGSLTLAAPVSHANLTIFPVYGKAAPASAARPEFVTLGQGMSNGEIRVTEPGETGSCPAGVVIPPASCTNAQQGAEHRDANLLLVANPGSDPAYVPDGTVVPGGDQDRGTAADTIVPARSANVSVAAFCVERNRSQGSTPVFNKDVAIAMPSVRYAMQVVGEQQPVWNAVAVVARRGKSQTDTGTYHALIENKALQAATLPYADALTLPVQNGVGKQRPVGVVVAINGRVVCADLYRSPTLFAQLWPSLLRSYAIQAVISPHSDVEPASRENAGRQRPLSRETAGRWLARLDAAPGAESRTADLTRVARVATPLGAGIRTVAMTGNDPARQSLLHEAFWTPDAALTN